MKLPLTGGCQCGKLRYEITEAPQDWSTPAIAPTASV